MSFTTYDFANRPLVSGQAAATFSGLNPDATAAFETADANWLVVRHYDTKPSTTAVPWSLFSSQITPLTLTNVTGRLAAVASKSNGAWQVTLFSYDTDGRVATRYTYTQNHAANGVWTALNTTVSYARDLRDALTQRQLTVGTSPFNHWYDYNDRGLLAKAFASTTGTKPAAADVTYTYRVSGQVDGYTFLGNVNVPLKYHIRDQLRRIGDPATITYPFSARYAYHANGTVSEAEFYSSGTPAAEKRYKYLYTYDALQRLKTADFQYWNGTSWAHILAYDLPFIGYNLSSNVTGLHRHRETGTTLIDQLSYSIGSTSNKMHSVTDAVGATSETWDAETGSFTYDANGNLKTAPASPYLIATAAPIMYDQQNLPLSVTSGGVTTTYRYAEGQRITKQVAGGNTEVYLLDGATTLGVVTVDGAGAPSASYFNVIAGDKVVGRQPSGASPRRYYHTDLLGSTRTVVEGATVVESYDYDPWGLLMPGRTLGSGTKEGFTGKERDAETGLDYFGARHYMPALARWTAPDPLAEKHPEWSPYNYVLNNPLALIDPDGRQVPAAMMNSPEMRVAAWFQNLSPAGQMAAMRGELQPANGDYQFGQLVDAMADAAVGAYAFLVTTGASFTPADGFVSTGADLLRGNFSLVNTGLNFLPGPGGSKIDDVAEGMGDAARPTITRAYRRPANATTPAQRASVQGQSCVNCGAEEPTMVAGHKKDLVREYYETGTINQQRMRSLDAVQPECPTCSARGGAGAARYSREKKKELNLPNDR